MRLAIPLIGIICLNAFSQDGIINTDTLTATPTIRCIGIRWPIFGDMNGNAISSVRFRESGASSWNYAMPLMRLVYMPITSSPYKIGDIPMTNAGNVGYLKKQYEQNLFAGSIFHLKPGTTYEVEVSLSDPDGGGATQIISATTRPIPNPRNYGGRTPTIVTGGGDALANAVNAASPGDVIEVFNGNYSGGFTISGHATQANPTIVTTAPGQNSVVLKGAGHVLGISIAGSHIYLNGIRIDSFRTGIRIATGTEGVSVTRCTIIEAYDGILTTGNRGYYADNHVEGDYSYRMTQPNFSPLSGEGIYVNSSGAENVICYNYVSDFGDALNSYTNCRDNDFYGNDLFANGDDGMECDYSTGTVRIWGNSFVLCGNNGVTFQPFVHGPCYMVNNIIVHECQNPIKDRFESCDLIAINNTFVNPNNSTETIMRTYGRNNLFLNPPERAQDAHYSLAYHVEDFLYNHPEIAPLDIDYNGYTGKLRGRTWNSSYFVQQHERDVHDFHAIPGRVLSDFQTDVGLEQNGMVVTLSNILADPFPTLPANCERTNFLSPKPVMNLASTAAVIDKGIALPNIIGGYVGSAPDLGGREYGKSITYGPRDTTTWTYPWVPVYSSRVIGEVEMTTFQSRPVIDVCPNPFLNGINIKFPSIRTKDGIAIGVFNAHGQKVNSFFIRAGTARKSVYWDGRDKAGKLMAKGMYCIELRSKDLLLSERVIRLK